MSEDIYDLVVVGAGPGGYVAAIRAGQLGLKTALVEKDETLGGTCLNVGCIPSKALLESSERFVRAREGLAAHGILVGDVRLDLAAMQRRKLGVVGKLTGGIELLMKKNEVEVVHGFGKLVGGTRVRVGSRDLDAKAVLLATGSAPVELPHLPFDEDRIVSSTGALVFAEVPRRLVVVGAGAIGLELGSVWSRLGSEVTVVELLNRIVPTADLEMSKRLQRSLEKQGMKFRLEQKVSGAELRASGIVLSIEGHESAELSTLECDRLLVAVGRRPFSRDLGLELAGVETDERGCVVVDSSWRTSAPGIYAIGDLTPGPMLAHRAEEEGVAVVERIAGKAGHADPDLVPAVVYTHPELAQVGLTEAEAKQRGLEVRVGKFPFAANGRALCSDEKDGLVKILADAHDDTLLGVHILGPHASELISETVVAMAFGGSAEDLARTIHAHPTLSESVREAALAVDDRALHI